MSEAIKVIDRKGIIHEWKPSHGLAIQIGDGEAVSLFTLEEGGGAILIFERPVIDRDYKNGELVQGLGSTHLLDGKCLSVLSIGPKTLRVLAELLSHPELAKIYEPTPETDKPETDK